MRLQQIDTTVTDHLIQILVLVSDNFQLLIILTTLVYSKAKCIIIHKETPFDLKERKTITLTLGKSEL